MNKKLLNIIIIVLGIILFFYQAYFMSFSGVSLLLMVIGLFLLIFGIINYSLIKLWLKVIIAVILATVIFYILFYLAWSGSY